MKVLQGLLSPQQVIKDYEHKLDGKVVFITGGASGIGQQAAIKCCRAGAKVFISDLNMKGLETTARICKALPGGGQCLHPTTTTDVTSESSLRGAFESCLKDYGSPPDVVVANAGVAEVGKFLEDFKDTNELGPYPKQPFWLTLNVNLKGLILTSSLAQEYWKSHPLPPSTSSSTPQRRLILLSSMGGLSGIPGGGIYASTKHAVMGYWVAFAKELKKQGREGEFGISVVNPVWSATPILKKIVLLLLSGAPKVLTSTIASSILYLSSPLNTKSYNGVLLPDEKDPIEIDVEEFDHLGEGFYKDLEAIVVARQVNRKFGSKEYFAIRNREALEAMKMSPTRFVVTVAGAIFSLLGLIYLSYKTPTYITLILGGIIGGWYRLKGELKEAKKHAAKQKAEKEGRKKVE